MNNTLAVVIVAVIAAAAVYAVALMIRYWDSLAHGWIADDPDEGMSDVHPDLRDRPIPPVSNIPPFVPSMGGSPAEAHLLASSYYALRAPGRQPVPTYCPDCKRDERIKNGRIATGYPVGVPRLCDLHAPTARMAAVHLDVAPTLNREMHP